MSFEVKFTPEAEETYDALTAQLRHRWGDKFVLKFENRVSKCLDLISATPDIYPIAEIDTEVRKCVLHKNCSMLYKVYDNCILVVCFWDNRQDPLITA
jgi:plasmid stabilization system protein ParE